MPEFAPRLDILPPQQRQLWDELAQVPSEFVLYGGTAIALRLGHRQSVDFDLSAEQNIDTDQLAATIPFLRSARIVQRASNTLSVAVDRGGSVRVSFYGLRGFRRLRPPDPSPDNGLLIASLLDLAGTKASVVQVRAEARDYIDLDAIATSGHIDLPTALAAAAAAIYGRQFNPQITLKALSYFEDGNLATLAEAVKARLAAAARETDLDRLPAIEAQK
jgi:hypothetical protein